MDSISIEAVFVDIDGTLTVIDGTPDGMDRSPLQHLEDILMEDLGLTRQEALGRIAACGDMRAQCLSEFLGSLRVSPEVYFERLRNDLARHVHIAPDAVDFLRAMKRHGLPVYTATTNSPFMSRVKLSLAGLADREDCPWLAGYYSGATFKDPLGKHAPDFYRRIISHGHFHPRSLVMIGDDPERDGIPALKAGFRLAVTIDRQQIPDHIRNGDMIHVNSLRQVIPLLIN